MSDSRFYDTNILVYAHNMSDKPKRDVAAALIGRVLNGESIGVISSQILGELFVALTKRIEEPLSREDAADIVMNYAISKKWVRINYTDETIKRAIFSTVRSKAPFWDVVIAETMKENGVFEIVTANEEDFKGIDGIRVVNPFRSQH